ncbi:hypothetical protein ACHAXN_005043 [Cyclotella atomus]
MRFWAYQYLCPPFKATGVHCDSLDLYIKAARRLDLTQLDQCRQAKALAGFFNHVTNGEVPEQFQTFLRQTYLVALEKDPDDKTKLRPLGVPSAIRRIAAIIVLKEYSPIFADHLLPFNYAIGVSGGVDIIVKTIQLAVDKYIIKKETNGKLPTRALVSLDIKNMFNAVSRERLWEIFRLLSLSQISSMTAKARPSCKKKMVHGSLLMSLKVSLKAAMTSSAGSNHSLNNAQHTELNGDKGDDNLGSLGFILRYVDDVNCILHHDDVEFFLQQFEQLATPLGAILNKEKTRIMTTTTGESLIPRLKTDTTIKQVMAAVALEDAIATYSTTKNEHGIIVPYEVTDGLRVLGAPVGSFAFCNKFIDKAITRAQSDAVNHAVYNTPFEHLPNNFWLWDSEMATQFSAMTSNLIAHITNGTNLPPHAQLMANVSINEGGLGIQTPRTNTITAYMTTSKRCLQ